jgi:flavin-dependent dehydrogenase
VINNQHQQIVKTTSQDYTADLIVLATGVNSRSPLDPTFGYTPPRTDIMAQDEIPLPTGWSTEEVSVYFRQPPGLIFGALTPKGEYLNVSLLGKGMTVGAIQDFFDMQGLTTAFPSPPESLCGCTPRIVINRARRYYGDRWVAVGDAAATRLYKDGIGSAFLTSKAAMQAALYRGISKQVFRRAYAPYCQRIENDNRYGKILFGLWSFVLNTPPILEAWIGIARSETVSGSQGIIARILWGMFTGDEAYSDLLRLSISPPAINKLWKWVRMPR